ncbi:MAG: arginine--tRNA ligase [Ruminococcaceae bacterium]|nr:arginine--tRNA ligase [Oscillospiraceae bacterium]
MQYFKKKTAEKILEAITSVTPDVSFTADEIAGMLEYPPDQTMGDVAFPCFRLSKILRSAPPKIAADLAEKTSDFEFGTASAVGGYLNFKMSSDYLAGHVLGEIEEKGEKYGSSDIGKGKSVVLDYSSPNICKPFHIGHLGTTVIGHSLKLLHEFVGYDCTGINYLGDWGTQFGKQIVAFRKWGDRETIEKGGIDELVKIYVKFHEEAEKDPSLNNQARAEFHKLEEGDEENLELWRWFVSVSLAEYNRTYKQLGIEFDSYKGESFYTDKMPAQVQKLRESGLMKIDDGASIVDLSEYNMPPCLILKKDGSTLYPTRDIAAAVYRKQTYDFEKCIYVTSSAQSLHFAQWFKVVELMGYDWFDKLVHVPYGTVSVDGAKLATRTGNVVLLKDLFRQSIEKVEEIMREKNPDLDNKEDVAEAVGVGAIVFNYLFNSRIKDINFTLDQALSFEGSTGPYAQYTYARTCSILEKAKDAGIEAVGGVCTHESEEALLKTLSRFPEKIEAAINEYEPSNITRYIIDVCTAFNRFYRDCPIVTAENDDMKKFRVRLTKAAGGVLKTALHLICMRTPEKI